MSVLPRCICDPLDAMVGKYDPRCNRHLGVTPAMTSPTPVLPVEHTVEGLMELVKDYGDYRHDELHNASAREFDAIRAYAERLAAANQRGESE